MLMKMNTLFPVLLTSILLTACPQEDPRYHFAREAIQSLVIVSAQDDLYLRFVYHGQPPVNNLAVMVLIRYSYVEEATTMFKNFAYFSESEFYQDAFANDLYGYRNSYTQLSASKLNDEFGFTL
jgi:hypothetical protein